MTRKELILTDLQKMDLDSLELILNDDRTYQDTSKEQFLKKLRDCFNLFKNSGDTQLHCCPGICISCTCSNKGKSGYSFVGNISGKHLDMIFEESETNFLDIYCCSEFGINVLNCRLDEKIYFDIHEDEKDEFKPSAELAILFQHCEMATNEIIQNESQLSSEVYKQWIIVHKELFESIEVDQIFDYKTIFTFYNLYESLSIIVKIDQSPYKEVSFMVMTALQDYKKINLRNSGHFQFWIDKYQSLFDSIPSTMSFVMWNEYNKLNFTEIGHMDYNLHLDNKQFQLMLRFKETFAQKQLELSQHYNKLTELS